LLDIAGPRVFSSGHSYGITSKSMPKLTLATISRDHWLVIFTIWAWDIPKDPKDPRVQQYNIIQLYN